MTTDTSDRFTRGLDHIRHAVDLLGRPTASAVLSLLGGVLDGRIDTEGLAAVLAPRLSELPPSPAPAFPQPADFDERPVIGEILGRPVVGEQVWETVDGTTHRYTVHFEHDGLHLECDSGRLCILSHPDALEGMPLPHVDALGRLWSTGAIDQLARIAAEWLGDQAEA